jgi:hypothetical protein
MSNRVAHINIIRSSIVVAFSEKEEQEIAAEENDAQFTHDDLNELISDDEEEDHLLFNVEPGSTHKHHQIFNCCSIQ